MQPPIGTLHHALVCLRFASPGCEDAHIAKPKCPVPLFPSVARRVLRHARVIATVALTTADAARLPNFAREANSSIHVIRTEEILSRPQARIPSIGKFAAIFEVSPSRDAVESNRLPAFAICCEFSKAVDSSNLRPSNRSEEVIQFVEPKSSMPHGTRSTRSQRIPQV